MKFAYLAGLIVCAGLFGCGRTTDSASGVAANNVTIPPVAALGYRIELKEAAGFGALTMLNQVSLNPQPMQCVMVSSGNDPSIGLPRLTVAPPIQFAVRAELTVPAETMVEMYYTTTAVPTFSADHVVSVQVKSGKSIVLFEINDPLFNGGLRLDPGQLPGEYVLHSLEFFASGPIALGKSPPPAPTTKP
jgi:hypothetical protein